MTQRFEGKTAVVTGGAGNIGLAAARLLIAGGAQVMLVDVQERELDQAVKELGARAFGFRADVTSAAEVAAYAKAAAERLGRIDIFFNNAGIEGPNAPITEFSEDAFDQVLAVNVRGVFLGMKYMVPAMRDGGSIIITSSIAGLKGSGNFVAYTTSKHAVIGIMRDAAIELGPRKIRVNTVHPGFVKSDMLLRILRRAQPDLPPETLLQQFAARTVFGQCITPDEIAATVGFLAGEESRMITGLTLVIDAGTLIQ